MLALIIISFLYIVALAYSAYRARKINVGDVHQYLTSDRSIGPILGFLSFSATLFSTFTLMGMPDFFRTHGVGAWIFLGVTDTAMAFLVLWFGLRFRKRMANQRFEGMGMLLKQSYGTAAAGYVFLTGIVVFLVPYVAIQIRGVSIFVEAVSPFQMQDWVWSLCILLLIFIYSLIGGMRAIMYSDAIQGVLLLVVTWIIAVICMKAIGTPSQLFDAVKQVDERLLSVPGPKGLFSFQFLIASFLAILVMPITQPQLTSRIAAMRTTNGIRQMAAAVGIFAFLVILPTISIGFYGSIRYPDSAPAEFLAYALVKDQAVLIGAVAIVGLVAAAMSTADSQLFSIASEFESTVRRSNITPSTRITKSVMFGMAVVSFAFALISSDQLVLLARVSFAGTALLAPMVLVAVIKPSCTHRVFPWLTAAGLLLFLLSSINVLPVMIGGLRMDLGLLICLTFAAVLLSFLKHSKNQASLAS